MEYSYAEYVPVLKALSDETRLKIVDMLSGAGQSGSLCACKILEEFSITQPTLSYHMKILKNCGIVVGTRDGAWMHYRLNRESVDAFLNYVTDLTAQKPGANEDRCGCGSDGQEKKI